MRSLYTSTNDMRTSKVYGDSARRARSTMSKISAIACGTRPGADAVP